MSLLEKLYKEKQRTGTPTQGAAPLAVTGWVVRGADGKVKREGR